MIKLTTLFLLLTVATFTNGQSNSDKLDTTSIERVFETAPEPIGGMENFFRFLKSNLVYPKDARKQRKKGEVLVEFIVSSDGTVKPESARIAQGVFESIDKEALRVIKLSPKWRPGTRNGRPIEMRMVMPINFNF